ncbi:hypothetical protein T4D_694 [Trichinella pseudospiralis]|uniref:Uncharacterized protein n=1 Tax=Trichinella pseudospiralis TaxID=6337 RepID=A0A0V1FF91_TRIPS|nr:hypothetical protein T4D_694 [Trichinella pseudospiralis]
MFLRNGSPLKSTPVPEKPRIPAAFQPLPLVIPPSGLMLVPELVPKIGVFPIPIPVDCPKPIPCPRPVIP